MKPRLIGWCLVAVQVLLLAAIVALPRRDDWPTPAVVDALGWVLIAAGAVIAAVAASDLGAALTPTPEPKHDGRLRITGAYGWVRHPIYSGVLTAVVGATVRSGSFAVAVVAALTLAFFVAKTSWEERRLAARYPGYAAYAIRVGRFVPRFRRGGPARRP